MNKHDLQFQNGKPVI